MYESYGTGTTNPFYGFVDTIIVSPWLGTGFGWVLMDRGRGGLKFQRSAAGKPGRVAGDPLRGRGLGRGGRDVFRVVV